MGVKEDLDFTWETETNKNLEEIMLPIRQEIWKQILELEPEKRKGLIMKSKVDVKNYEDGANDGVTLRIMLFIEKTVR